MRKAAAALLLLTAACAGGDNTSPALGGGTLVIATGGDPNSLLPPLVGTTQGRQVTDLVYDRLASLGDSLNTLGDGGFIPQLAQSWTWAHDSLSIAFHLNPRAKWHDGVPVTSSDVRFTLGAYRDSSLQSTAAALISSIDSVSAPDSVTAVVWFHSRAPEQFYNATDQMSIIPEHIWKKIPIASWRSSDQANHPIGSGQFRFASWKQGESVTLVADTGNYRGRPKLDRIIWSIAPDFNAALARFLGGETDFFEAIRADAVAQAQSNPNLKLVAFQGIDYSFLQFNLRDPRNPAKPNRLFADRELRRALTMAVDRNSIVRSVYDSLAEPALAGSLRAYPTADRSVPPIPFDIAAAGAKLDSLGWRDSNGDSIREKNGHDLAFNILVPSSSKARTRMAVLIQEQLRRVGVTVGIEPVEFPVFSDRSDKSDYDAEINSIHADPSPSGARQDWATAGIKGGNNTGSYSNPVFDALVDSATAAYDPAARNTLFRKAYRVINDDAPAIWLAEPKAMVGVQRRIHVTGLRPDAWWQHIADWWIPAKERIARDASGAVTTDPAKKNP
ncbi:MAG: peptide ABC transporter substrate-binding protein [Gemmatimonadaceae bacterium]|nr:peptide ABC transporter substrate-binding protein [Gemmatimonadaceae bacterium]